MIPVSPNRRSECPIASSLDLVGDKWTLLVLRDVLDGKRRFSEFERSPESIPTNILTERLRRLVDAELLVRVQTGKGSRHIYEPTSRAEDLRPVLLALAAWGNEHLAETWVPPANYLRSSNSPDDSNQGV
ncbi:MAG: helix-turn-helix domain-containing protein [Acidimicrobiia bacterium]|nr:helix-turn-helix domain-containing protein [Acidimicrobiia bacterium]